MPYVIPYASIQATTASQQPAEAPQARSTPPIPQLPAEAGGAALAGAQGVGQTTAGTLQPPFRETSPIPQEVIPLVGIVFTMLALTVIGLPIARAIGRVIERRGQAGVMKAADVAPQLRQLQDSVDAMSIELERIGEAQRFTAKLMSERVAELPAGGRPSA